MFQNMAGRFHFRFPDAAILFSQRLTGEMMRGYVGTMRKGSSLLLKQNDEEQVMRIISFKLENGKGPVCA